MPDIIYKIVIIVLFIVGVTIAYILGRTHKIHTIGDIIISDSDDPSLEGKVQFIFDEEIEKLITYKYVMLEIHNQLGIKYNHDNEETK